VWGEEVQLHCFFTSEFEGGESQTARLGRFAAEGVGWTHSRSGRFGGDRNLSAGTQTLLRPAHRLSRTLRLNRDKSTVLHKCTEMDAGRNITVLKKKTEHDGMRRLIPSC